MRFVRPVHLLLILPLMAALAALPGCDGGAITQVGRKRPPGGGDDEEKPREELIVKTTGTIKGKVELDGTPPVPPLISMGSAEAQCHRGAGKEEIEDETWLVSKNGGVRNVVIILQPPPGKFFKLTEAQQKPKEEEVKLTQPHCAFKPRVFALFPSFYKKDGKPEATGQSFTILNNAEFAHNYKITTNSDENSNVGGTLGPKDTRELTFKPQTKPILIQCDIHAWMKSYGFILEHPFYAITDKDGNFEIKDVPVDMDLRVVAWHEAAGFFNGGEEGKSEKLKDKQELNFKVKK
jgi:hypothetical protein